MTKGEQAFIVCMISFIVGLMCLGAYIETLKYKHKQNILNSNRPVVVCEVMK